MSKRFNSEVESIKQPENGLELNSRVVGGVIILGLAGAALVGCSSSSIESTPSKQDAYRVATAETHITGVKVTLDNEYADANGFALDAYSVTRDTVVVSEIFVDPSDVTTTYEDGVLTISSDELNLSNITPSNLAVTRNIETSGKDVGYNAPPSLKSIPDDIKDLYPHYADASALEAVNDLCLEETVEHARSDIEARMKALFVQGIFDHPSEIEDMKTGEYIEMVKSAKIEIPGMPELTLNEETERQLEGLADTKSFYDSNLDELDSSECFVE